MGEKKQKIIYLIVFTSVIIIFWIFYFVRLR